MPQSQPSPTPATMPSKDALQRLLDGLQNLVREHLALARAEAKEDLRAMGRDLAYGAAGVPPLAVGYLMLMLAFGYLLAQWLAPWAAFGIVALANLSGGAALTIVSRKKLLESRLRKHSAVGEELQTNKAWLSSLTETTRPQPDGKLAEKSAARLT
jgi:Putative Actinobacterial Holin-X, holin superfamily III